MYDLHNMIQQHVTCDLIQVLVRSHLVTEQRFKVCLVSLRIEALVKRLYFDPSRGYFFGALLALETYLLAYV